MHDTTRIASGDPELWADIFDQNPEGLLQGIQAFAKHLGQLRRALESSKNPAVRKLLAQTKRSRDRLA